MKALTLTQPWATLVAIGAKRIETRSWHTLYRGPLAIHAAKAFPVWAQAMCTHKHFRAALHGAGYTLVASLPRGAAIAIVTLADITPIIFQRDVPPEPEATFGDYTSGRWAWHLTAAQMLAEPVPAKGALGLWEWDEG